MSILTREQSQRKKYDDYLALCKTQALMLMGQFDKVLTFFEWNEKPENQPLFEIPSFYRGK